MTINGDNAPFVATADEHLWISTWKIENLHVEKKHFPRGREIKLRRNQMKLRRKCFSPMWGFFILHVGIFDFPRGGLCEVTRDKKAPPA